ADAARIGQLPPRRSHPDGFVSFLEVRGQLAVRHRMERADLHGSLARACGSTPRVPGRADETAELARDESREPNRRAVLEIRSDRLQPDRQATAGPARGERRRGEGPGA